MTWKLNWDPCVYWETTMKKWTRYLILVINAGVFLDRYYVVNASHLRIVFIRIYDNARPVIFFKYKISITMLTDCESLFKVIVKSTATTERRQMFGVRAMRHTFDEDDISNIRWIVSAINIANTMTKTSICKPKENLLARGSINFQFKQWIFRRKDDPVSQFPSMERNGCNENMNIHYTDKNLS